MFENKTSTSSTEVAHRPSCSSTDWKEERRKKKTLTKSQYNIPKLPSRSTKHNFLPEVNTRWIFSVCHHLPISPSSVWQNVSGPRDHEWHVPTAVVLILIPSQALWYIPDPTVILITEPPSAPAPLCHPLSKRSHASGCHLQSIFH